jgi:PAS domain S-box-containing protein
METIGLTQVLRILPVAAMQVRVDAGGVMLMDANLPCRVLWPRIPEAGGVVCDELFGSAAASEIRRIASGGGIAQIDLRASSGEDNMLHIAHCGNDSALVVIHDGRRLRPGRIDPSLPRLVMEKVSDWILWVGPDDQIVYTSPAVQTVTGYTAEELMFGESVLERLVHEEDRSLFFHHKQRVVEDLRSSHLRFRIRHRDGSVRWVAHSCHPVYESDGSFRGIVSSNKDITTQKRVEEQLLLMQFSMEHAHESVIWLRRDASFFYVNEATCRLLGYSQAELLGMSAGNLNPAHDLQEWEQYWANLREREAVRFETLFRRADGTMIPVEISANFLCYEGREFNCSFVRDITERRRFESELITAKERAEQSERLKDAFVATVSHEIRTPLNIISGYTQLLRDEFASQLEADTGEFFASIQTGVRRLERTVDLILNISRIQSGDTPIHPKPMDLDVFLRQRIEDFRHVISSRGIALRYHAAADVPSLLLDEYSMTQAIDNLLDNANKFTRSGTIAVRLCRPDASTVSIEIEDTGIGISDTYLPYLFERYSQEDVGLGRKFEGIGLGMSLVREYLRLNGGTIAVRSAKGEGTTFTICFPTTSSQS